MSNEVEPISGGEVELISDGNGLAVMGEPTAVERFLGSIGLSAAEAPRFAPALGTTSAVVQAGSEIAANSGRWVKLTKESAQAVKAYGLMPTKTPGVSHAMIGQPGKTQQWIQVVKTPGAMMTNPAMLAGGAAMMTQIAMQQQMSEITNYLVAIDAKLDKVLRGQTNQVLSRLDGVDLAVREAMTVRDAVGRVSETTWSKVQSSAQTIHETQGYALRHLGDLADQLEESNKIADLADAAKEAETEVRKWIMVLARCFELHEAVGVLELDRVLDASPDELDRHRLGLTSARRDQREVIGQRTEQLLARMEAAVAMANSKVLFNPKQSPAVVRSSNLVAADVHELHEVLGIESGRNAAEARQWKEAAAERWDSASAVGAQGVDTVKQLGSKTTGQARAAKDKLAGRLADRKQRRSGDDGEDVDVLAIAAPPIPPPPSSPPAWATDPHGRHELRYWNGTGWTEHVSDNGVQTTDPI